MAQFIEYRSTDGSAPVLDSNADATNLINLLDKILVTGYGSKSAAGWGHPFTGSATKQVYRPGSGTRFYLRILDDGSLTGARRVASAIAGESMSDVDTFTNQFPTAIQDTSGMCWRKSTDVSATARPWIAFADDRTLYLFIQTGDTGASSASPTGGGWAGFMFGDFYSYVPNDAYNCLLVGIQGSVGFVAGTINFANTAATDYKGDYVQNALQATFSAHYVARNSFGMGSSTACAKKGGGAFTVAAGTTSSFQLAGILAFPNGSDSGLWVHPIWIMDCLTPDVVHGHMRGLFHQLHAVSNFADGDTFSGVGTYSGKSFKMLKNSPHIGIWTLETSNTLDTN